MEKSTIIILLLLTSSASHSQPKWGFATAWQYENNGSKTKIQLFTKVVDVSSLKCAVLSSASSAGNQKATMYSECLGAWFLTKLNDDKNYANMDFSEQNVYGQVEKIINHKPECPDHKECYFLTRDDAEKERTLTMKNLKSRSNRIIEVDFHP
jgi:hypothetical protein